MLGASWKSWGKLRKKLSFVVDDDLLLADGDGEDEEEVLPAPDALIGSEATIELEKESDGKQKLKPLKNEVSVWCAVTTWIVLRWNKAYKLCSHKIIGPLHPAKNVMSI